MNKEVKVAIDSCHTACGWVGMASSPSGLLALTLPQPTQERALKPLLERWGEGQLYDDPRLNGLKKKLQQYFDGQRVLLDEPFGLERGDRFPTPGLVGCAGHSLWRDPLLWPDSPPGRLARGRPSCRTGHGH